MKPTLLHLLNIAIATTLLFAPLPPFIMAAVLWIHEADKWLMPMFFACMLSIGSGALHGLLKVIRSINA